MKYIYILLLVSVFSVEAQGYDTTFNGTGFVYPPYETYNYGSQQTSVTGKNALLLPDGKIILHTYGEIGPQQTILRKYNADGSVDTGFGVNGVCTINYRHSGCELLSDGKILLIEYEYSNYFEIIPPRIRLARLNSNGTIDTGFGTNGVKFITNLPIPERYYNNYFFTPNGNIYILSQKLYTYNNEGRRLPIVIRLKPDCTLDDTFSDDGIFIPEELDYRNLYGSTAAVVLDNQSLILNLGANIANTIIKILPNGTLDAGFGTGGIKTLPYSFRKIIRVNNDKFWTARYDNTILRYNSDFSLDTTFGTNGIVIGSFDKTRIQADGKVVTVGVLTSGGFVPTYSSYIKRYLENGSLEASQTFVFRGTTSAEVENLEIQPDGKILICGGYRYPESLAGGYYKAPVLGRIMQDIGNLGFLSINELNEDSKFVNAFPNPFNDQINISVSLQNEEDISIKLYDIQGRYLETITENETFPVGESQKTFTVSSHLSKGIFILEITSESGYEKTLRLIKE